MAPRKGESNSRTSSARGSYQISHCETFGLRRSGVVLDPAARQVTDAGERPCSGGQFCFALTGLVVFVDLLAQGFALGYRLSGFQPCLFRWLVV